MYISHESKEQMENRLNEVLKNANLKIFEKPYYFKELSVENFHFDDNALAMVKDEDVWSYLTPTVSQETENFKIFSFHFKENMDNSGFVGWLASKIKVEIGSGVFVICGQNTNRGGIFDYWGCPIEIANDVLNLIKSPNQKTKKEVQ